MKNFWNREEHLPTGQYFHRKAGRCVLDYKNGLKEADDTEAFVFFTADQPWLRGETVLELIELFLREGKGIACVEHSGKTGNPCIFSRKYFGELMELEGDVGGKRVIRKHREDTAVLEVLDERELTDVDVAGRITKYGRR